MPVYGIISEFNPFHNGHKRILDSAREFGTDKIVVAMSGNAVQRGELSVLDKYTRAEAAVRCGADLVLELPFPWCSASAEYFARCGVYVLSAFCDNIIFGSECGDIELLSNAAETTIKPDFADEYRARLEKGEGAAKAYFTMLEERGFECLGSNDILGIEYIKASKRLGVPINFHTIKRDGAKYNSTSLDEQNCPSATALRMAWKDGILGEEYIPAQALLVFKKAIECGDVIDENVFSGIVLSYFRLAAPDAFTEIADTDGGIANRIVCLAKSSKSTKELFEELRTKRYTDAKMRRAVLFCMTQVKDELLKSTPVYTTLLAADKAGREMLSKAKKEKDEGRIGLVTKPADAPRNNGQFKANDRLDAIFSSSLSKHTSLEDLYRKKAFICDL